MDEDRSQLVLAGRGLRAAVAAAETSVTGYLVRQNLIRQLGIDELFDLDLSEYNVEPAVMPNHPPGPADE